MGLPYMPINWGGLGGQCRHIWQSHGAFGTCLASPRNRSPSLLSPVPDRPTHGVAQKKEHTWSRPGLPGRPIFPRCFPMRTLESMHIVSGTQTLHVCHWAPCHICLHGKLGWLTGVNVGILWQSHGVSGIYPSISVKKEEIE